MLGRHGIQMFWICFRTLFTLTERPQPSAVVAINLAEDALNLSDEIPSYIKLSAYRLTVPFVFPFVRARGLHTELIQTRERFDAETSYSRSFQMCECFYAYVGRRPNLSTLRSSRSCVLWTLIRILITLQVPHVFFRLRFTYLTRNHVMYSRFILQ